MGIVLKRPEVADKYICNLDKDLTIHAVGYSGPISNVNQAGADHLVKSKTGYLTPKETKEKGKEKEKEKVQPS